MKRRTLATILATVTVLGALTGCASGSNADTKEQAADTESEVVLKGVADLVPHSEIIEYVTPKLAEQGIKIELVSTAADSTTNEKLNAGEIDFNYFQHEPYLLSEVESNGYDLCYTKFVGNIRVYQVAKIIATLVRRSFIELS